ncbi:MAG: type IV pilus modification protein PilV [Halofilum sp. (in: g-proteobacteria)]
MRLNAGFSLIEVLVSLVILSIGLLGVAALQLNGLRYTQGAYQSSQATVALSDLVDRMRTNPDLEAAKSIYTFNTEEDTVPTDPGCNEAGCNAQELARLDVRQWRRVALARLASGEATVELDGDVYTLTLTWHEATDPDGDSEVREAKTSVRL